MHLTIVERLALLEENINRLHWGKRRKNIRTKQKEYSRLNHEYVSPFFLGFSSLKKHMYVKTATISTEPATARMMGNMNEGGSAS
mmetsp:Transcript_10112/g.33691  ORF Transcript_10112/g.33691 Transcript_10112/m.33691 type:complete len:85 (+) Transcript_10112:1760-2014(+)